MDSTLVTILTGGGACGVFVALFVVGLVYPKGVVDDLKEENHELKQALADERERADAAVTAASATRDILAAIQVGRSIGTGSGP